MTSGREVPHFEVARYASRRSRYCCAVFVLNENGRLHAQLGHMRTWSHAIDIIVADGGSTDGSTRGELLSSFDVTVLLTKRDAGALSAQMRMALAFALDEGYEGVITIDGNNKDDVSAIPLFIDALDAGADHVQGSRFIPGGHAVRTPLARLLGIRLLHAPLISLSARKRYTDTTNGFRAYSRRLLADPRVAPFRAVFKHYELHYYLAIRAARLGMRVCEVPVTRSYPVTGKIPTKITPIRGSFLVLRTLFAACLHRFDPPRQASDA